MNKELIQKLIGIVGEKHVLSHPVDLSVYECDAETLDSAKPDLVVLPASTEEVSEVVKLAHASKIPVVARGAGTGLSGGATCVRGGISLVLTRMNRVLFVSPEESCALVQVGATNVSVSQAASRYNLYFAPDPSSQTASTVGGNVAENAGGPHTLKYGMTTHHVLGLKVVLADGQIVTVGGVSRTSNDLDLAGIIVGSEGTLAIATEAVLKLIPKSDKTETLLAYFPSVGQAGQAVSDIVAHGVIPAAMEMIDNLTLNAVEDNSSLGLDRNAAALLIVELDGQASAIAAERKLVESCLVNNGILSSIWARDGEERATIWKARKTAFGALGRIAPHGYVLDGVIPRSKLAEAIDGIEEIGRRNKVTVANVYHAGDGNLHPCMLYHRDDEQEVVRVMRAGKEILLLCVKLGGTLSGEHGIGIEKMEEMPMVFSEDDLELMGKVKQCFDPDLVLNPGKMFPHLKGCGESGRTLLRHKIFSHC
ncbi:MAG: FAD-binding protein [Cyanobacteria bacterium SZAS TMP-1]|nr:FAD-binding protein [Cyanobacteria bacterium SZAS TMP-1]